MSKLQYKLSANKAAFGQWQVIEVQELAQFTELKLATMLSQQTDISANLSYGEGTHFN